MARSHAAGAAAAARPPASDYAHSARTGKSFRLARLRRAGRPRGRRRISQLRRAQYPARTSGARHAGHFLARWRQPAAHAYLARAGARYGAPGTAAAHDRARPGLPQRERGCQPRAHVLPTRRHDDRSRGQRRPSHLLHEDTAGADLSSRSHGASPSRLLSVCRARLRARYPMPDLRRPRLPGVQAERLGRAAAVRAGESQRAAHERHRPRRVERIRIRARPDAPGDDALRDRRHPPASRRRPQIPGAVLSAMKFSYNWLREFVPGLTQAAAPLEELITIKTAECEGIEQAGALLANASIVRVAQVEPIAGAHAVKAVLDNGKTVVCGAPNCRAGMTTVYVPVGKKVIHGVESDGMLASASELGINKDHSGIVELAGLDRLCPDSIIEIDNKSITHRPDLWGHHGMAREVAAILGLTLTDPSHVDLLPTGPALVRIAIEDFALCPRYSALVFENVKVEPSPLWLQYRLTSIGLNPINNIVDMTNFVMAEIAQPMHAFDADLLKGDTIFVRPAKPGEPFRALNGESYALDANK